VAAILATAAAMRPLAIEHVAVRGMRNLAAVDLDPGPRFNVISGDNGQGKTNFIEAVYVLCTSKSFRASRPGELVAHDGEIASVRAELREEDDVREQSVGVKHGSRLVRIDGKKPPTLAAYAVRTPVVVFHPGVVALSMGGGTERRRLLDRVALYLAPSSLADAEAYARALRERQKALEVRGERARDLDEWEEIVVRHGLALSNARADAAAPLAEAAARVFARIGAASDSLSASYARSAPLETDGYRAELARRRSQDARRGAASMGPHRDDLLLQLGAHPVRGIASQGQHRAVVLALKLAEIESIGGARGVRPILLLDDVSSELDRSRTAALFAFLQEENGQVFLTTTRRELIDTGDLGHTSERRDFGVIRGEVRPLT
jgi:DNA replication and repair protein RecF